MALAPQIQSTSVDGQVACHRQTVLSTRQDQHPFLHAGFARVNALTSERQHARPTLEQAKQTGKHHLDRPALSEEGGAHRPQRSVPHQAPCKSDPPRIALTAAIQVQLSPHDCECSAREQPVVAASQRQRSVNHCGASHVGVCALQCQRPGAALDEPLRSAEHRRDVPGERVKRRSSSDQTPALDDASVQSDSPRSALAVAAQVQHASSRGNVILQRQAIVAALQQQRAVEDRGAAAVAVRSAQA